GDHRHRERRLVTEELQQVLERGQHPVRVVLEAAESGIAVAAQQPAYLAGQVAMVDGRRFGEFALADGALAVLPREHRLGILPRQPVSVLELLLAAALTLRGEPGGAKVRVRRVSLFLARGLSRPLLRSERRTRASVLLFVGAVLGEQLLTVVRVFRV